jgi:hypothetical protein
MKGAFMKGGPTPFVCALTNLLLLTPIITTLPTLHPHRKEANPTRKKEAGTWEVKRPKKKKP